MYQRALEFFAISSSITTNISSGQSELVNQFKRSSLSIVLNIAEGTGKSSQSDKKRFFAIARGSALESAAVLDVLRILELCEPAVLSSAKQLLHEVVSMLSVLVRKDRA